MICKFEKRNPAAAAAPNNPPPLSDDFVHGLPVRVDEYVSVYTRFCRLLPHK